MSATLPEDVKQAPPSAALVWLVLEECGPLCVGGSWRRRGDRRRRSAGRSAGSRPPATSRSARRSRVATSAIRSTRLAARPIRDNAHFERYAAVYPPNSLVFGQVAVNVSGEPEADERSNCYTCTLNSGRVIRSSRQLPGPDTARREFELATAEAEVFPCKFCNRVRHSRRPGSLLFPVDLLRFLGLPKDEGSYRERTFRYGGDPEDVGQQDQERREGEGYGD